MTAVKPESAVSAPAQDTSETQHARRPNIEAYIRERVQPQIDWHERASRKGKRMYWSLSSVQLGATATVPIVNTMGEFLETTIVTSVLAGGAAIATGFVAFGKHQENWLRSRKTVSALEEVLARYLHAVDPFNQADADTRFVRTIEDILRGEHESWHAEMATKAPSPAKSKRGRGAKT